MIVERVLFKPPPGMEPTRRAIPRWRDVTARTGAEPVIRYFDPLMGVDNETGSVTEWSRSGDAQPHAQELCVGDRGRRIRAALAAARHPPMG